MQHDELAWHTSTFSSGNGNGCVEVAFADHVLVRDTKDRALPPHHYTATGWAGLLAGVRAGTFDDL